jgi:hypothetical protein
VCLSGTLALSLHIFMNYFHPARVKGHAGWQGFQGLQAVSEAILLK